MTANGFNECIDCFIVKKPETPTACFGALSIQDQEQERWAAKKTGPMHLFLPPGLVAFWQPSWPRARWLKSTLLMLLADGWIVRFVSHTNDISEPST